MSDIFLQKLYLSYLKETWNLIIQKYVTHQHKHIHLSLQIIDKAKYPIFQQWLFCARSNMTNVSNRLNPVAKRNDPEVARTILEIRVFVIFKNLNRGVDHLHG